MLHGLVVEAHAVSLAGDRALRPRRDNRRAESLGKEPRMSPEHERPSRPDQHDDQESGLPGGGRGRVDRPGHSGVYPVSHMEGASGAAPVRGQMSWGQGERGAEGYYDSGSSEAITIPVESEPGAAPERGALGQPLIRQEALAQPEGAEEAAERRLAQQYRGGVLPDPLSPGRQEALAQPDVAEEAAEDLLEAGERGAQTERGVRSASPSSSTGD